MQNFQSISVENPVSDTIIAINSSFGQYVDEEYFRKYFLATEEKITKDNRRQLSVMTYPVKTVAVEVGWILNTD